MWNFPGPGIEPMSPELAGRFLSTALPGKSWDLFFFLLFFLFHLANVNIPSSSFFKLILDLSIAFCSHSHLLGPRPEHIRPHSPTIFCLVITRFCLFSYIKIGEITLEAALSIYFLPHHPITVGSHLSIAYKPYLPSCQAFHKRCWWSVFWGSQ